MEPSADDIKELIGIAVNMSGRSAFGWDGLSKQAKNTAGLRAGGQQFSDGGLSPLWPGVVRTAVGQHDERLFFGGNRPRANGQCDQKSSDTGSRRHNAVHPHD